jgi:hypothetical protein
VKGYHDALAHVLDLHERNIIRLVFRIIIGTLIHLQLDPSSAGDTTLEDQLTGLVPLFLKSGS